MTMSMSSVDGSFNSKKTKELQHILYGEELNLRNIFVLYAASKSSKSSINRVNQSAACEMLQVSARKRNMLC